MESERDAMLRDHTQELEGGPGRVRCGDARQLARCATHTCRSRGRKWTTSLRAIAPVRRISSAFRRAPRTDRPTTQGDRTRREARRGGREALLLLRTRCSDPTSRRRLPDEHLTTATLSIALGAVLLAAGQRRWLGTGSRGRVGPQFRELTGNRSIAGAEATVLVRPDDSRTNISTSPASRPSWTCSWCPSMPMKAETREQRASKWIRSTVQNLGIRYDAS